MSGFDTRQILLVVSASVSTHQQLFPGNKATEASHLHPIQRTSERRNNQLWKITPLSSDSNLGQIQWH